MSDHRNPAHQQPNLFSEANAKGQPILVGTSSIEKPELLSQQLINVGIKHNVLNARQHEQEAQIVADAGKLGAVTIATNMAPAVKASTTQVPSIFGYENNECIRLFLFQHG